MRTGLAPSSPTDLGYAAPTTMADMEILRDVLLIFHFIGLAALFGVWFSQLKPGIAGQARIVPGMLHGALTAGVAGLGLVAVGEIAGEVDRTKIGVKLAVLIVILVLIIVNRKKDPVSPAVWWSIGGLTLANICVAVLWH